MCSRLRVSRCYTTLIRGPNYPELPQSYLDMAGKWVTFKNTVFTRSAQDTVPPPLFGPRQYWAIYRFHANTLDPTLRPRK